MVLICDICRQDVSTTIGTNATICLFPCFHKYCERCKDKVFNTARQQQQGNFDGRVTCKLCNQNFQSNVLYDYSENENQIEKIFCLHCNIKNKAPVEWRCKTCQNRFLCAQCSQPHYQSGHEIEPMKPNIPPRSQCHTHRNIPATFVCSCQTNLCDYCLNMHANGQTAHPHEQRFEFARLAEQARSDLDNIRRQSQVDLERIDRSNNAVIGKHRQAVHQQASQARTAVAGEVLELVNAVIRRGNDIVTYIDIIEDSKLKHCAQLEQEMKLWTDRLKKIESFTQNALVTIQQDHPGMWSASMFVQNALMQVNKRRGLVENTLKSMERLPRIIYQSGLGDLKHAIRSFGMVNVDGELKVPAQTTPAGANMFTVTSCNNANVPIAPSRIRQAPPNVVLAERPGVLAPNPIAGTFTGQMMAPPQRKGTANQVMPNQPFVASPGIGPHQNSGILPQLLQQPNSIITTNSRAPPCSAAGFPQPNAPIMPLSGAEQQFHLMNQAAMLAAQNGQNVQQQRVPLTAGPQQQQTLFMQHQQRQQQQHERVRQQQMAAHQLAHNIHAQKQVQQPVNQQPQQLRSPPAMNHQLQQHPQMLRQIQMQNQQQMMNQQQQQQLVQGGNHQNEQLFVQQQQQMEHRQQQQRQQSQAGGQNSQSSSFVNASSVAFDGETGRPPILLRIPNPRQQSPHLQNINFQPINPAAVSRNAQNNVVPPQIQHYLSEATTSSASHSNQMASQHVQQFNDELASDGLQQCEVGDDRPLQAQQREILTTPDIVELFDEEEVQGDDATGKEPQTGTPETLVIDEPMEDCAAKAVNNPPVIQTTHQPTQAAGLPKQKAQSVAADSTVTTRESISPTAVPTTTSSAASSQGVKRKHQEPAGSNVEKRSHHPLDAAFDPSEFAADETDERSDKNVSPMVISTTTTDNGEAVQQDDGKLGDAETLPITQDCREERRQEQSDLNRAKAGDGPKAGQDIPMEAQPGGSQGHEEVQTALLQNYSSTSDDSARKTIEEGPNQSRSKTPTKCTIVSPIQLAKMVSTNCSSSSSSQNMSQKQPSTSNEALKEAMTTTEAPLTSNKLITSPTPAQQQRSGNGSGGGADDMWDDYCYVCSQGCDDTTGSLGCCETCPHVFHAKCHVPRVDGRMEDLPDDWRCSICIPCEPLVHHSQEFGEREKLLCAKVYMACFEENNRAELFLNAVPRTETDYYTVIKQPIWLYSIADKVSKGRYKKVGEFVADMNLLFRNFSEFHPPNNPLAINGKDVYARYVKAIRKFLPAYQKKIWLYVSLYSSRHSNATSTSVDEEASTSRKPGRPRRLPINSNCSSKSKSQTPA